MSSTVSTETAKGASSIAVTSDAIHPSTPASSGAVAADTAAVGPTTDASIDHDADMVNLLDLAAAALTSTVAASSPIREFSTLAVSASEPVDDDSVVPDRKNARVKLDGSVVTNADFASQGIIVRSLRDVPGNFRIVGEESQEEMEAHMKEESDEEATKRLRLFHLAQQELYNRYNREEMDQPPLCRSVEAGWEHFDSHDDLDELMVPEDYAVHHRRHSSSRSMSLLDTTSNDDNHDHVRHHQVETPRVKELDTNNVERAEYMVNATRVSVFIDPLDGTKAYAKGDYETVTILVAIILDNTPYFGVITKPFLYKGLPSLPDTGIAVYGGKLIQGVFLAGGGQCFLHEPPPGSSSSPRIDVGAVVVDATSDDHSKETTACVDVADDDNNMKEEDPNKDLPRAVISSSRSEGIVKDFVEHLAEEGIVHKDPILVSGAGEKSLRLVLGTENESLWFFPKPGTARWDVAASDALLRCYGGLVTDKYGKELDYGIGKEDAENSDGIIASNNAALHAACVSHFQQSGWMDR